MRFVVIIIYERRHPKKRRVSACLAFIILAQNISEFAEEHRGIENHAEYLTHTNFVCHAGKQTVFRYSYPQLL